MYIGPWQEYKLSRLLSLQLGGNSNEREVVQATALDSTGNTNYNFSDFVNSSQNARASLSSITRPDFCPRRAFGLKKTEVRTFPDCNGERLKLRLSIEETKKDATSSSSVISDISVKGGNGVTTSSIYSVSTDASSCVDDGASSFYADENDVSEGGRPELIHKNASVQLNRIENTNCARIDTPVAERDKAELSSKKHICKQASTNTEGPEHKRRTNLKNSSKTKKIVDQVSGLQNQTFSVAHTSSTSQNHHLGRGPSTSFLPPLYKTTTVNGNTARTSSKVDSYRRFLGNQDSFSSTRTGMFPPLSNLTPQQRLNTFYDRIVHITNVANSLVQVRYSKNPTETKATNRELRTQKSNFKLKRPAVGRPNQCGEIKRKKNNAEGNYQAYGTLRSDSRNASTVTSSLSVSSHRKHYNPSITNNISEGSYSQKVGKCSGTNNKPAQNRTCRKGRDMHLGRINRLRQLYGLGDPSSLPIADPNCNFDTKDTDNCSRMPCASMSHDGGNLTNDGSYKDKIPIDQSEGNGDVMRSTSDQLVNYSCTTPGQSNINCFNWDDAWIPEESSNTELSDAIMEAQLFLSNRPSILKPANSSFTEIETTKDANVSVSRCSDDKHFQQFKSPDIHRRQEDQNKIACGSISVSHDTLAEATPLKGTVLAAAEYDKLVGSFALNKTCSNC